jgi:hypothetical protein
MTVVKPFLSQDSLRMVYYPYFHSVMSYGLIFWRNSYYSNIIFKLQKRIIRIIVAIRGRGSCTEHFKTLKMLPLQSQYILSLLLLVVDNGDNFRVNSEIHNINSIQFFLNSIYFAFIRSRRGLFRPIGYRTCQLVYIIVYTKETTN